MRIISAEVQFYDFFKNYFIDLMSMQFYLKEFAVYSYTASG